jgi:hypothetical protein
MTPLLFALVRGNQIQWKDLQRMEAHLRTVQGECEIIVRRKRRSRSLSQNSYYWAVVIAPLAGFLGYTTEELHDALRAKFLREPNENHKLPDKIRSTSDLTTVEFELYAESIRQWAAIELSYVIPLPNETVS